MVSTALLVPEVEATVRYLTRQDGRETNEKKSDGSWQTKALPVLADEAPPGWREEIRGVFTDRLGPRLRHRYAHGTLEKTSYASYTSVYVWWIMLRLVLGGWKRAREETRKID